MVHKETRVRSFACKRDSVYDTHYACNDRPSLGCTCVCHRKANKWNCIERGICTCKPNILLYRCTNQRIVLDKMITILKWRLFIDQSLWYFLYLDYRWLTNSRVRVRDYFCLHLPLMANIRLETIKLESIKRYRFLGKMVYTDPSDTCKIIKLNIALSLAMLLQAGSETTKWQLHFRPVPCPLRHIRLVKGRVTGT